MQSRGGVTGGLTLSEVLREYEQRGFRGQFVARPSGQVECISCQHEVPPEQLLLRSMRRVEGVSDPADMSMVAALECPRCGALGTATFMYGPYASPEEGSAMRALQDVRRCVQISPGHWECEGGIDPRAGGDPLRGPEHIR